MTDPDPFQGQLVQRVLEHPCPDCGAPAGVECGDPTGWAEGADPPRPEWQHASRLVLGQALHAVWGDAMTKRLERWPSDDCPTWCREHLRLHDVDVHGRYVRALPTSTLGVLHTLVIARRDEPDRAAALIVHDDNTVVGQPLEEAVASMPHLFADVVDAQHQARSTRPRRGED